MTLESEELGPEEIRCIVDSTYGKNRHKDKFTNKMKDKKKKYSVSFDIAGTNIDNQDTNAPLNKKNIKKVIKDNLSVSGINSFDDSDTIVKNIKIEEY